jgi:hypothetical protein
MKANISSGLRVAICMPVCLAAFATFAQTPDSNSVDLDSSALQRILQYESLLGSDLSTKVGICVDDVMGKAWIIDGDPSQEIRSSVLGNLRHASETCAVTMSSQKGRLAAQLREMTERQLQLAMKLEKPVAASRTCLKSSTTTDAFRTCIAKVIGKPPTEIEMDFWSVLIQRFSSQQGKL